MMLRSKTVLLAAAALAGCTTPYSPPIVVHGGAPFIGIAGLIEQSEGQQVDVLMVHGMCSHTREQASQSITMLVEEVDRSFVTMSAESAFPPREVDGIEVETRTVKFGNAQVRFTALVWSPLTQTLKAQLAYDHTGTPTGCSIAGECKPQRAKYNGKFKDGLLDDCLSDVMIYQGVSKDAIRGRMVNAIAQVIEESEAQARASGLKSGPFALVAESLGSKISFDALQAMANLDPSDRRKAAGDSAVDRLALIFMEANQLPLLGLAEQSIEPPSALPAAMPADTSLGLQDSLQELLKRKSERSLKLLRDGGIRSEGASGTQLKLSLVAFTDPNDLLSYRLMHTRYVEGVEVADVLVSNDSTLFGLLELPNNAHTDYRKNKDVTRLIACGSLGSKLCK